MYLLERVTGDLFRFPELSVRRCGDALALLRLCGLRRCGEALELCFLTRLLGEILGEDFLLSGDLQLDFV